MKKLFSLFLFISFSQNSKLTKLFSEFDSYDYKAVDSILETINEKTLSLKTPNDSIRFSLYKIIKLNKGLSINTVGKNIKNLKAFLHWCFDKEVCTRFPLKHMVVEQVEADKVYLTEEEIQKLYALHDLSTKEKETRDLFLIACETGMRFKNLTQIKKANYQDDQLIFFQVKSSGIKAKLIIPLSDLHREIASSYNYELPKLTYNAFAFNQTLRPLCEKAGIDQEVLVQKVSKYGTRELVSKKYELVSSYTARRSFCTNKFLKGLPASVIMKFSGHSSERSFLKYLKLDAEVVAKKYKAFFKVINHDVKNMKTI